APEARLEVGLRIRVDAAQMQIARHGRRRRIYGIDRRVGVAVEGVGAELLPIGLESWLFAGRIVALRQRHAIPPSGGPRKQKRPFILHEDERAHLSRYHLGSPALACDGTLSPGGPRLRVAERGSL